MVWAANDRTGGVRHAMKRAAHGTATTEMCTLLVVCMFFTVNRALLPSTSSIPCRFFILERYNIDLVFDRKLLLWCRGPNPAATIPSGCLPQFL